MKKNTSIACFWRTLLVFYQPNVKNVANMLPLQASELHPAILSSLTHEQLNFGCSVFARMNVKDVAPLIRLPRVTQHQRHVAALHLFHIQGGSALEGRVLLQQVVVTVALDVHHRLPLAGLQHPLHVHVPPPAPAREQTANPLVAGMPDHC